MLSRLEREGLITRKQEWKTKFISLTDAGRELLGRAYPSQLRQQAAMFDDVLDEDEKTQLHALMKKLYEHSVERSRNAEVRAADARTAETPSQSEPTYIDRA